MGVRWKSEASSETIARSIATYENEIDQRGPGLNDLKAGLDEADLDPSARDNILDKIERIEFKNLRDAQTIERLRVGFQAAKAREQAAAREAKISAQEKATAKLISTDWPRYEANIKAAAEFLSKVKADTAAWHALGEWMMAADSNSMDGRTAHAQMRRGLPYSSLRHRTPMRDATLITMTGEVLFRGNDAG